MAQMRHNRPFVGRGKADGAGTVTGRVSSASAAACFRHWGTVSPCLSAMGMGPETLQRKRAGVGTGALPRR